MAGQYKKLTTQNLLEEAFESTVNAQRHQTNQLASRTMGRFTVLLFGAITLLLMICWY